MRSPCRRGPTSVSESLLRAAWSSADEAEIVEALRSMALVSAHNEVRLTPLAGGVSSAIFRADLPSGVVCVKRALSRLRVAADWRAPVERNHYEAALMRVAGGIVREDPRHRPFQRRRLASARRDCADSNHAHTDENYPPATHTDPPSPH